MVHKILIVTSAFTGAGHKSITDSLVEQFSLMPDIEVKVIDGFEIAGRFAAHAARLYGSTIRHMPWLYNLSWRLTDTRRPGFPLGTLMCRRRFIENVRSFEPDIILTVHSLFNTLITNILKRNNLNIPVVVVQADLATIHSTWCNPDAYMTVCPTSAAYASSLAHNMQPDKLRIMGFPVRRRFVDAARSAVRKEYDPSSPLHILLMGGGEGSTGLRDYAEKLLKGSDAILTIICGRNKKLYSKLQKKFGSEYGDRVTILGFVDDIENDMLRNDILIARGSPNTLYEAVMTGIPVIMTGPFLEQERGNFTLAEDNHLGVICNSPADVIPLIESLLSGGAAGLAKIREAQENSRCYDNARNIALFVRELTLQRSSLPHAQP